jgi:CubicO group peptidase (beta-lactamase class C family)
MSLQNTVQSILNELCADPITSVPGAVVFAADRKGNTLAHAAAGVRGVDKPSEKMAPNQLFAIHSCTKLITAIAAMQLVEQGKLSLDAPIDGILPELKGQDILENGKRRKNTVPITLNHLLSHTVSSNA